MPPLRFSQSDARAQAQILYFCLRKSKSHVKRPHLKQWLFFLFTAWSRYMCCATHFVIYSVRSLRLLATSTVVMNASPDIFRLDPSITFHC